MLSDGTIRSILADYAMIRPDPKDHCIQPASVDIHIGNEFMELVQSQGKIDLAVRTAEYNSFVTDVYTLPPDGFLLARTQEYVDMPSDIAAHVEGRSTLARIGLLIHTTAGFIDPGFQGHITLELKNVGPVPIVIRSGMGIAQLCFHRLDNRALREYGDSELQSKYRHSNGVVGARVHK